MTANISKEVEFVRHGIEEAAGELISRLKPRSELRITPCTAKIGQITVFFARDVNQNSIKVSKTKLKMQEREVIVSMTRTIPDFQRMISQSLLK